MSVMDVRIPGSTATDTSCGTFQPAQLDSPWFKTSPQYKVMASPAASPAYKDSPTFKESPIGQVFASPLGDVAGTPEGDVLMSPKARDTPATKEAPAWQFAVTPQGQQQRSPAGVDAAPMGDVIRGAPETKLHVSPEYD
eukprot:gene7337-60847_t